jgi:sugar phosphate isomerase/epimerase
MRLGAPLYLQTENPEEWAMAHRKLGYGAAYCPNVTSLDEAQQYARAAQQSGLVIAEVGAWCNPLSRDEAEARKNIASIQERLALAEAIGARCCVNIAGSRGQKWDGPDPDDLTEETFDAVVQSVREIIDAVKPTRTFYTLEPMPWMYPDSAESYERLIVAIDRPAFGVHYDPVNLVNSPERYFRNGSHMRDFIRRLGPRIKSVHAKDSLLRPNLTTHLDEVRPGLGKLDYAVLLTELEHLNPDLPLMVEHLDKAEDYDLAVQYIRGVADSVGILFK